MNFQGLKHIEDADKYIDVAFRKASKHSKKYSHKDHIKRKQAKELAKLDIVRNYLVDVLSTIVKSYPSLDQLDPFYQELIKATLHMGDLKKSLGAVNWASQQVHTLTREHKRKIQRATSIQKVAQLRKQYYGRVSSVLKQVDKNLKYLEEARKTMKAYPAIKTSMFTVCLFGFPNVGKTTLLSKLTDATPEINSYAFTTKSLNMGYIRKPGYNVQVIDTPGTLNRRDKMNLIELQAFLAVHYLADLIVFVLDPTMDLQTQISLLRTVERQDKEIWLFVSKTDVAQVPKGLDYDSIFTDAESLKEELIKKAY